MRASDGQRKPTETVMRASDGQRKPTVLILAVCSLLVILISVVYFSRPETDVGYTNKVRIGTILDLTGPAASFGEMQQQGIELALEDIHASECASEIEVFVEDSRLDPRLAVTAATKLIESDHVVAITSVTGSSMALAVAPIANRARVSILDSLSSSPALTSQGGDFYFRIQPADTYAGVQMVTWAKELGVKTSAVVYADNDWGQGILESIEESANDQGLVILATDRAKQGDLDFRPMIARLREVAPDMVFLVAHPQEAGLFLRQADEADFAVDVMGSDNLSGQELIVAADEAVDGVRFIMSSGGQGEKFESFRQRFVDAYKMEPSSNSVRAYDALMILHHVICTHGAERDEIYQGLQNLDSYMAIIGPVSFDHNGDIQSPHYDRFEYRGVAYDRVGG